VPGTGRHAGDLRDPVHRDIEEILVDGRAEGDRQRPTLKIEADTAAGPDDDGLCRIGAIKPAFQLETRVGGRQKHDVGSGGSAGGRGVHQHQAQQS
jgi:hypothetical protein